MQAGTEGPEVRQHVVKRGVDVVAGTLLAVAAIPVIAVAAAATAVVLRTWPFFVQHRIGHHGRHFRFIKIRTLPRTAPRYADKYALQRVKTPKFSQFLRRTKIDELPQLFLVPVGRMSLVGPRPEMPTLHQRLDPHFAASRTSVRPGCTGIWQISDRADVLIGESPEYDEFYIRNACLRLDLWLLGRTVRRFVGGRRVNLGAVPQWALRAAPLPAPVYLPDAFLTESVFQPVLEAAEAS